MTTKVTLTVKGGQLDGAEYMFEEPTLCMMGRAPDCDIQLPNEVEFLTVSRHHCLLDVDPPQVQVWDCRSRNGTHVNGMRIETQAAGEVAPDVTPRSWEGLATDSP